MTGSVARGSHLGDFTLRAMVFLMKCVYVLLHVDYCHACVFAGKTMILMM